MTRRTAVGRVALLPLLLAALIGAARGATASTSTSAASAAAQRAIYKLVEDQDAKIRALEDKHKATATDAAPVMVMVVGAGRGPLVAASLAASVEAGVPIRVYAVEKNANAVICLQNRVLSEPDWAERVTVVNSDMREWVAPAPADILVSELLGSWGDNELSPECLDGAQRFLRPGGISIPCDYTSFVAPLSSH